MTLIEKKSNIDLGEESATNPCPLHSWCKCNFKSPAECCYWNRITQYNFAHCDSCISKNECLNSIQILSSERRNRIIEEINDIEKYPELPIFNSFIPKIDIISDKKRLETHICKFLDNSIYFITVGLNDLLYRNTEGEIYLKPIYRKSLHSMIPGNIKIILATNIKDIYCKYFLDNPETFIEILFHLRPDFLTTLDANFYSDLPEFIVRLQAQKIMKLNERLLSLGIPLIGLVPPNKIVFEDMFNWFYKRGITTIAIPMLEMNRKKKNHEVEIEFSNNLAFIITKKNRGNDDPETRRFIQKKIFELSRTLRVKFLILSGSPNSKTVGHYYSSKSWLFVKNKYKEFKEMHQMKKLRRLIKASKMKSAIFYGYKTITEFMR